MKRFLSILLFAILPVIARAAAAAVTIDPTTKNFNTQIGGVTVTAYNIPSGTTLFALTGSTVDFSAATVVAPGSFFGGFAGGSAAAPSITFTGDTDTGIYRIAANQVGITAGGALTASFTSAGIGNLNGTVSAPSFFFTSDPNTGIYRIGADELGIAAGGVNSAIFDAGSVTTNQLLTTRTDGDYQYRMTNSAQTWGIAVSGSSGGFVIDDITHGTAQLYIAPTTGRVGIVQASPSYQLDVTGDGRFTGGIKNTAIGATSPSTGAFTTLSATGAITSTSTGQLLVRTGASTSNQYADIANTGGRVLVGVESSTGGSLVAGSTAYASILASNNSTPVQIGVSAALVASFSTAGLAVTGTLSTTTQLSIGSADASGGPLTVDSTSASGAYSLWKRSGVNKAFLGAGKQLLGSLGADDFAIDASAGNFYVLTAGAVRGAWSSTGLAVTGALTTTGEIIAFAQGNTSAAPFRAAFQGNIKSGISLADSTDTSGAQFAQFTKASGVGIGSINRVTTTDAVAYNTTSDARLKTNIRDFTDSGRLIDALRPRLFDWKSGGTDAIGFVAQEENAADPAFARIGAVTVGDDDPDTITRQWARSDSNLVPIIVAELKALRARVQTLESR